MKIVSTKSKFHPTIGFLMTMAFVGVFCLTTPLYARDDISADGSRDGEHGNRNASSTQIRVDARMERRDIREGARNEAQDIKDKAREDIKDARLNASTTGSSTRSEIRDIREGAKGDLRENREQKISALKENIDELKKKIEDRKTSLKTEIQEQKAQRKDEKQKKLNSASIERVNQLVGAIFKKFDSKIELITKVDARLAERINAHATEGQDTTSASALLVSARLALVQAKADISAASSTVAVELNASTTKSVIRDIVKTAEASIKTSGDAYKKVVEAITALPKLSASTTISTTSN